jgi:hypothetical protein
MLRTKLSKGNLMKSFFCKGGQVVVWALIASGLIWSVSIARGAGHNRDFKTQDSVAEENSAQPQGESSPTPTPTPTPTPGVVPPQIDAVGTIDAPNGGRDAQFFIFDVENEQVTPQFLEGEFGYIDKKSHVSFITGKIQTCTVNGNTAAFTGTARIGGPKNKQIVQFTVSVTANQIPASNDTFSIVLSNGYTASGNLTSGKIVISTRDPD